jgi:hypothetical protein
MSKEQLTYPESEKLNQFAGQRNTVVQFLEWLSENEMQIRSIHPYEDNSLVPRAVYTSNEELAHQFLGIDSVRLDKERRRMLENAEA